MSIRYKNVKNVKRLDNSNNAFICDIDIDIEGNGNFKTVEYCARPGGAGLCDSIINDILSNNFEGTIIQFRNDDEKARQELIEFAKIDRNSLLKSTDWTQLPDVPEGTKQKWAKYRQELRDITKQKGFPENIKWPKAPN